MSGGSFDYLCSSENPASSSAWDAMRHELVMLGADDIVAKMDAVTDALATLGQPYGNEAGSIRDVWHAIEWWRSGDSGIDRVRAAILAYRAKHPRVAEREVEFAPVEVGGITDRERACLRGEHKPAGEPDAGGLHVLRATYPGAVTASGASPDIVRWCAHCRCAYVPRSA